MVSPSSVVTVGSDWEDATVARRSDATIERWIWRNGGRIMVGWSVGAVV